MIGINSNNFFYLIIVLISLIIGFFSSIYYYEDIDSLRFALALKYDYDLLKMQPHFPGYPVFHFIGETLYSIINSLGLTFSIIGSCSQVIIIYGLIKIFRIKNFSEKCIVSLIVLFNPLISIMASRYMPDLLGLSIVILIFYCLIFESKKKYFYSGFFLSGILFGIRLSYWPLALISGIYALDQFKNKAILLTYFILGVLVWLVPLVVDQGFYNLISAAQSQTLGHFTDFGGTIISETNFLFRIQKMFHSIWADALGGYWQGRSFVTLLSSACFLLLLFKAKFNGVIKKEFKIIIVALLVYTIWILLFQNVIYKSRHILPILIILIILLFQIVSIKSNKAIYIVLVSAWFILTINLKIGHKNGTAINKLKEYISTKQPEYIVSHELINYYLKRNGIKSKYINYNDNNLVDFYQSLPDSSKFFLVGDFSIFNNLKSDFNKKIFYHNPYINRMWSKVSLYESK